MHSFMLQRKKIKHSDFPSINTEYRSRDNRSITILVNGFRYEFDKKIKNRCKMNKYMYTKLRA